MQLIDRIILASNDSKNFSELTVKSDDGEKEFDVNDNGKVVEELFSNIQAEQLLLNLLYKLTDREKIILLYLIVREAGYNLIHEDCAKTLSLTREHYMYVLKGLKTKCQKIIQSELV